MLFPAPRTEAAHRRHASHTAPRPPIPRRDTQAGPEGAAMYPVAVQYLQARRVAAALVHVVACLWYLKLER